MLLSFGWLLVLVDGVTAFIPATTPHVLQHSLQKTQQNIVSSPFQQAGVAGTADHKKGSFIGALFPNLFQPHRRRMEGIPTVEQDPYAVAARGDWRAYLDNTGDNNNKQGQASGQVYYFNVVTGVSQWNRPRDFPAVQLTSSEQRQALKIQQKYREQVAQHVEQQVPPNEEQNSKHWLISGIQYACAKVSQAAVDASVFATDRPKTLQVEGSWKAYVDKKQNNSVYYYNTATGESQWKPPTPTFPHIRSSASKRVVEAAPPLERSSVTTAMKASTTTSFDIEEEDDGLVGLHGNWRAYFDAADSCLVYYVNVKQGTSQWEAPPDFPAVTLRPAQLAKMAVKRQQVALWREANTPLSWEGVWNVASHAAGQIFNNNQKQQQQRQQKNEQAQQPSWNPFANAHDGPEHNSFNVLQNVVSSLFQPKEQDMDDVLFYEVKKNFFMPDDEPVHDSSATHPVERVSLEEKRLNDSRKRQANLRKNYDAVILNRSPTVSLTAFKRDGKTKDWYQNLEE